MATVVAVFVIVVGLICWLGQSLVIISPTLALKYGLVESEDEMDSSFYIIETKATCINDILFTWILPLSAILMLLDNFLWPYLALVGGGVYLYLASSVTLCRIYLEREGKKVGGDKAVKTAYIFSGACIAAALAMIVMSSIELSNV